MLFIILHDVSRCEIQYGSFAIFIGWTGTAVKRFWDIREITACFTTKIYIAIIKITVMINLYLNVKKDAFDINVTEEIIIE